MAKTKNSIEPERFTKEGGDDDNGSESCADTHTHAREDGDFPTELLDGNETDPVEVMRKVFTPDLLSRQYWRLMSAKRSYRRADGSMGEMDDVATQLRATESVLAYLNGKPAVALPAGIKLPETGEDLEALVEKAKTSPVLRDQIKDQLRKMIVRLEKLDVESKG